MYETALPDETRQRIEELAPAGVVVGIPSYRNSRTVGQVAQTVAQGLAQHYGALAPLIVHADGHSFDDTLTVAAQTPLPPSIRRIATRYHGLPGKGSAIRAICEIATLLQARALLIVEADVVSVEADWSRRLLDPVLNRQAEFVLPMYQRVQPLIGFTELIIYPLLQAMFHIPARYPTGGEIAMAGGVAAFFAERDVWETDVAREGIDVWMTVEATLGGARLGQATLGPKYHRTPDSLALIEAKFLQEVGALFRMGYLHERRWRAAESLAPGISTFGEPVQRPLPPLEEAQEAEEVAPAPLRDQWQAILMPPTLDAVIALFEEGAGASFNDQLWARVVYDFLIVYNLGEGDPDKVVTSLFPLYQLRWRTLKAEAARHPDPQVALDRLIERQAAVFNEEVDYLFQQWTGYVSPEQRALWRTLGRRKRQR